MVLAVVVIIVIAAVNRDSFCSLVERDMILNDVQPGELPKEPWLPGQPESAPAPADTLQMTVELDSVTVTGK